MICATLDKELVKTFFSFESKIFFFVFFFSGHLTDNEVAYVILHPILLNL